MQSQADRRVLITGVSGFTGRHLAATLSGDGWTVFGLGPQRISGLQEHLDADLAETEKIAHWLAEVRPTHVVHLAALAHVVGDPLSFYRVNVLGTESLLEALVRSGVTLQKVLLASSANVYGNATASPITEETPLRPMNHYARSKVAMESLAPVWGDQLPISIVRPFNYTGPGQSEAYLFPKIVASHFRRDPILRLGNINVSRDLSDISYVCEAYQRLLREAKVGEVVNVCSGIGVSIADALTLMGEIAGYSPRVEVDPSLVRAGDVLELWGDPSRLHAWVGGIVPPAPKVILRRMFAVLSHRQDLGAGEA